jgi:cobyrinic acid a,c-diamide synthase
LRSFPRIVLAAASSDGGKTTIALGLIGALRRRGLRVAAAKVGPDFIDAAHLARASGAPARNLDAWLAPPPAVLASFTRGAAEADVAVVEGVMGMFDGRHGTESEGSTAHLARILDAPVILVLDCAKSAATIGAIAFGLARFDPRVRVAGAILNRVASDKHAATVAEACRRAEIPVFGIVRRDERMSIPSRHLGLIAPEEAAWTRAAQAAADATERDVDLDALLATARSAPPLAYASPAPPSEPRVRVAWPRDEAFWFYDEASLEALRDAGAELVRYSPLREPFPNDVRAAFIGGGYPELHAAALEANVAARDGLRRAIEAGMPVYAECGGLMYLSRALETANGTHAMVGAIPAISAMSEKRSALRYVEARAINDGPMFMGGDIVRGHEFHYSRTRFENGMPAYAFDDEKEGYANANIHASYVHAHLAVYAKSVRYFLHC